MSLPKRGSYNQECLMDCFKKLSDKFNPNTSGSLIEGMTNNMKYFSQETILVSSVAWFPTTFLFVSFFPFFFNLLVSFLLLRSFFFFFFVTSFLIRSFGFVFVTPFSLALFSFFLFVTFVSFLVLFFLFRSFY